MNFDFILDQLIDDIWATYDVNHDGTLEKEEVREFLAGAMKHMTIFQSAKSNEYLSSEGPLDDKVFDKFFQQYDANNDGVISRSEMLTFIKCVVNQQVSDVKESGLDLEGLAS